MTTPQSNIKQQKCIHHWIIDSPNGSTSYGRCKKCGAVAEFVNDKSYFIDSKNSKDSEFGELLEDAITFDDQAAKDKR